MAASSSTFLSDDELASKAFLTVQRSYSTRSMSADQLTDLMVKYIHDFHYHIVSQAIISACRAQAEIHCGFTHVYLPRGIDD